MAESPRARHVETIEDEISAYYARALRTHGANAQGVGWNGAASQQERFRQLSRLWASHDHFTLSDFGCGYDALLGHLRRRRTRLQRYAGIDLSQEMVSTARRRWSHDPRASFHVGNAPTRADFVVASGVLTVRLGFSDREWQDYIDQTLDALARAAMRGFAFNVLTSHADPEQMRSDLWYADPAVMVDLCLTRYSRTVELVHDFPLFEFTVFVRVGRDDTKHKPRL